MRSGKRFENASNEEMIDSLAMRSAPLHPCNEWVQGLKKAIAAKAFMKPREFGLLLDLTQTLQVFDFGKMEAKIFDLCLELAPDEGFSFEEVQSAYGMAYGLYQAGRIQSNDEWANKLFGLLGICVSHEKNKWFLRQHQKDRNAYVSLPKGFSETLGALKADFKLAVVSNGIRAWAQADWQMLGVNPADYFEFELYSSDTRILKPDARFFERACKELDLPVNRCAMAGDSYEDDVEGAHAVGLVSVWINPDNVYASKPIFRLGNSLKLGKRPFP